MRLDKIRMKKWMLTLSSGGVTLGILQGLSLVSFADLFTTLLSTWLSALVAILLGGSSTLLS
jgi:hypothetical protein